MGKRYATRPDLCRRSTGGCQLPVLSVRLLVRSGFFARNGDSGSQAIAARAFSEWRTTRSKDATFPVPRSEMLLDRSISYNCGMLVCWYRMTSDELEQAVEAHIASSNTNAPGILGFDANRLIVIKYLPAIRLDDAIKQQHLYAAERAGFTWGDALYVAPVSFPRTTMMYGEVGVVGAYDTSTARTFDESDPAAIALYQEWITWQTPDYLEPLVSGKVLCGIR